MQQPTVNLPSSTFEETKSFMHCDESMMQLVFWAQAGRSQHHFPVIAIKKMTKNRGFFQ